MKSLLMIFQEELNKVGLEFIDVKEYRTKFTGSIVENGVVILKGWDLMKCTQYDAIKSFVNMTVSSVEMKKKLCA